MTASIYFSYPNFRYQPNASFTQQALMYKTRPRIMKIVRLGILSWIRSETVSSFVQKIWADVTKVKHKLAVRVYRYFPSNILIMTYFHEILRFDMQSSNSYWGHSECARWDALGPYFLPHNIVTLRASGNEFLSNKRTLVKGSPYCKIKGDRQ